MTRRRLILAIVAAILHGTAWWLSLDRLSAEERLLVGTWTFDGKSGVGHSLMRFEPDRRSAAGWFWISGPAKTVEWGGRWFIRDGAIVFDGEPDAFRRTVRPFLRSFRLPSVRRRRLACGAASADGFAAHASVGEPRIDEGVRNLDVHALPADDG
jgi:hypothetical protein